jgi:hypothetical protein
MFYLYISRTTDHKGHVLSFPNVVSIYSTDCISELQQSEQNI